MDGSIHDCTILKVGHHQEDDQVVPEVNLDQTDDHVSTLYKTVLLCKKVVEFLNKETQSAQYFPDPFYIVRHRFEEGDTVNSLRVVMEIENRPVDKYLLEILAVILRYNYTCLDIDGKTIHREDSGEIKLLFRFTGFLTEVELQLVSSSQHVALY